MSERLPVDQTADTIQFQRIDDATGRHQTNVSPARDRSGDSNNQLHSSNGHSSSRRLVFTERRGPDLWLIAAIVGLISALAIFAGGLVVNQARDPGPTYQSVYSPENSLGGSQK
ncbi:hypothetical protein [Rhodococcus rhodochrous]|uniref:hypothetical protein n=1 Tax=Rhodococcus rhodochrous TaxID=1829 RepID=UPI00177F84C5|nr:hypothetical protein [Rhodococcus rhodochrous]